MDSKSEQPHILIVEDEVAILRTLKCILELSGFKVSVAQNGAEGLERAYEERPDLIIADVLMPMMDGLTMVASLRSGQELAGTPVIIYSNLSYEDISKQVMGLHVSACLPKASTDIDELLNVIKATLCTCLLSL